MPSPKSERLEFVHFDPTSSKDEQTRKQVRSQAMRDFRRKQRAEREAALGLSKSKHKPGRTREPRAAPDATPEPSCDSGDRPGASTSSTSPSSEARSGDEHPSPSVPHHWQGQASLRPTRPSPTRRTPGSESSASYSHCTADDCSSSQHASPTSELKPCPFSEEPLDSPAHIERMLRFCESYLAWLCPGLHPEVAAKTFRRAWRESGDILLLAACCLASVGHLDAVQPHRPTYDYELYKGRVLSEINRRIASPQTATTSETIGALCCLLSYEMSSGSGEAITHLRGLNAIVSLKGGIGSPDFVRNRVMLESLDLIHAILSDDDLVFTRFFDQPCRSRKKRLLPPPDQVFGQLIPLLQAEQTLPHNSAERFTALDLSHALVVMREGSECAKTLLAPPGSKAADSTDVQNLQNWSIAKFWVSLEIFRRHIVADCTSSGPEVFHIRRAFYLQYRIYYHTLNDGVSFRHSSNQGFIDELCRCLRNIKDTSWQRLPYLRLNILISAAASSLYAHHKSFLKAELVRAVFQLGEHEWCRVKAFFLRHILVCKTIHSNLERLAAATILA